MRWTRLVVTLSLLMTSGCVTRAAVRLPVSFCEPRPPLAVGGTLTPEGTNWIVGCLNAGRLNCVAIQANNGDDVRKCDLAPKVPAIRPPDTPSLPGRPSS